MRFLSPYLGVTLAKIARDQHVPTPAHGKVAKNYGAVVVRRLLNAGGARSDMYQFDLRRIPVKTVRVTPDLRPFEKMSFRAFRQEDLLKERWESSSLRADLLRLFIVVLRAANETTAVPQFTLSRAFFWSPTDGQMLDIEREWKIYQAHIRRLGAVALARESETNYIHIRPHGRDSKDLDPTAKGAPATRQSFWLNREFLATVVRRGK